MAQKVSVGLVVFTEVPGLGLVSVLQRRGEWNTEKMAPESYPGACQVTAHGKVEKGEIDYNSLAREIHEELGEGFLHWFDANGMSVDRIGILSVPPPPAHPRAGGFFCRLERKTLIGV